IALRADPLIFGKASREGSFYARVVCSLQAALSRHGYHALLCNTRDDLIGDGHLYCISEGIADAVIAETNDAQLVHRLAHDAPLILFNSEVRCPNVDVVLPDVERAVQDQVAHLVQLGHRSIACFRPRPPTHWQDRRFWREYEEHESRLGLTIPAEYLYPIEFEEEDHPRAIGACLDRLLQPGIAPTAILTSDVYAGELIRQLNERGLSVPDDISLVGFDDDTHAHACPIPLTTFRQDFDAMAETAVELLQERMKDTQRPSHVVEIAGKRIERSSSGPIATGQRAASIAAGMRKRVEQATR
ncbi:MAG: substrate-binding domain-containing protein, partial [Kiritimatiellae bacterium]|nr:substrate-binding domain-containing protein [Kiritimatiellia bacterium]